MRQADPDAPSSFALIDAANTAGPDRWPASEHEQREVVADGITTDERADDIRWLILHE